jgi:predicted HAD superfamily Cof-like phosphohydrolase
MYSNFEMVGYFMDKFGQELKTKPELPNKETVALRVDLIEEELKELMAALYRDEEVDLAEVADALTDILYVTYGAGHAFGIDLDKCFEEVQASNMSKLGEDGKPIYREDGKVLKGPNFFEPNLNSILYDTKNSL